tara:strand:- start:10358 stop:11041 length:684 start_codon:yes stop_codon:yes gene_type:complete
MEKLKNVKVVSLLVLLAVSVYMMTKSEDVKNKPKVVTDYNIVSVKKKLNVKKIGEGSLLQYNYKDSEKRSRRLKEERRISQLMDKLEDLEYEGKLKPKKKTITTRSGKVMEVDYNSLDPAENPDLNPYGLLTFGEAPTEELNEREFSADRVDESKFDVNLTVDGDMVVLDRNFEGEILHCEGQVTWDESRIFIRDSNGGKIRLICETSVSVVVYESDKDVLIEDKNQ